jgi:primase-polymerase (primpol)-like protein
MNSDIKDWADWAESQGWRVEDDAKGYTRFHDPAGNYIAQYPATPSRPNRRKQDLKTALKKAGLAIPPPSKKEQKAARRKEKDR